MGGIDSRRLHSTSRQANCPQAFSLDRVKEHYLKKVSSASAAFISRLQMWEIVSFKHLINSECAGRNEYHSLFPVPEGTGLIS